MLEAWQAYAMSLFKKLFGYERSKSGTSVDRLIFILIAMAVLISLYACHN